MKLKNCKICNAEIAGRQKTYCSARCRDINKSRCATEWRDLIKKKLRVVLKNCEVCQTEFQKINVHQATCSKACSKIRQRRKNGGKNTKKCVICKNDFVTSQSKRVTCSPECKQNQDKLSFKRRNEREKAEKVMLEKEATKAFFVEYKKPNLKRSNYSAQIKAFLKKGGKIKKITFDNALFYSSYTDVLQFDPYDESTESTESETFTATSSFNLN